MTKVSKTRVSIGILAWNEENCITETIESLAAQSIFTPEGLSQCDVEVICVPNGCKDKTSVVAESAFKKYLKASDDGQVTCSVREVSTPGKSNAWNRLVHDFADPNSDYIVLMDADILFGETDTLSRLIHTLEKDSSAHISVDLPVKDIAFKSKKGLIDHLSLRVSQMNEGGETAICGQLYCGRGATLRRIWMPVGLTLEDGFLTGMVRSDLYTAAPNTSRIARAPGASHVFEAYTSPSDIFRHQKAVAIGSSINSILAEYLEEHTGEEDAGQLIGRWEKEDPEWFNNLVRNRFNECGWWVIPNPISLRRFRKLRGVGVREVFVRLPATLAGFFMDLAVTIAANQSVKKSKTAYFWEKTRSE